jgi:hypothetical protein
VTLECFVELDAGGYQRLQKHADDRLVGTTDRMYLRRDLSHSLDDSFFQERGGMPEDTTGQYQRVGELLDANVPGRGNGDIAESGAVLVKQPMILSRTNQALISQCAAIRTRLAPGHIDA